MEDFEIDKLLFGVRVCNRCGRELPANTEHFCRDRHRKDGLRTICRDCYKVINARSYAKQYAKRKAEKT